MLLRFLQCPGQPPQHRIIQHQILIVPTLRGPGEPEQAVRQLLGCSCLQLQALRKSRWGEDASDTADQTLCLFRVLKEQWIRAKYERQEFMADGKTISPPGKVIFIIFFF